MERILLNLLRLGVLTTVGLALGFSAKSNTPCQEQVTSPRTKHGVAKTASAPHSLHVQKISSGSNVQEPTQLTGSNTAISDATNAQHPIENEILTIRRQIGSAVGDLFRDSELGQVSEQEFQSVLLQIAHTQLPSPIRGEAFPISWPQEPNDHHGAPRPPATPSPPDPPQPNMIPTPPTSPPPNFPHPGWHPRFEQTPGTAPPPGIMPAGPGFGVSPMHFTGDHPPFVGHQYRKAKLRNYARRLDEIANEMEGDEYYELADQLRALAQQCRELARSKDSQPGPAPAPETKE